MALVPVSLEAPVVVRANGEGSDHRTLDIPETQVLIRMTDTPEKYWHHVLGVKIKPGEFATGDPDGTVVVDNLVGEEVIPLSRDAPFPVEGRPFRAHGSHSAAQLAELRRRMRVLAQLHQPEPTVTPQTASTASDAQWLYADPGHESFGLPIAAASLTDPERFVTKDEVGLVQDAEEIWTFAELVAPADLDEWKAEKACGPGRDSRLLPTRAVPGSPVPLFRRQAGSFGKSPVANPLVFGDSPCAAEEVTKSIVASSQEPTAYAQSMLGNLGVGVRSGFGVEFAVHLMTLHLLAVHDGIDLTATAAGEHVCRRLLQQTRAARKNAKTPEYDGLEYYLLHMTEWQSGMQAMKFDRAVADYQRDKAQVMKQERLQREEIDHREKRQNAPKAETKPKASAKPRRGKFAPQEGAADE